MLNENPSCSSSASLSSRSNSSGSYSNQPSSSSPILQRQEETKGCSQDLKEQCWYWAAASKEEIGTAMENQQNGTFAVRDASTLGQYTLTLRIDGTNKLIKILVDNDKCGFTSDALDFDTVTGLIQFYRTCSLRDFNERLDTCLLHPLTSPQWIANQKRDNKLKQQMDPAYHINLLKCRLEGFHAEYDRVSRRYDQLFGQRSALADEHQRKKQTAGAYADALKIFERKICELRRIMVEEQQELSEKDREALAMNAELQEERMEEIEKAQTLMQNAIQNIGRSLEKIDEELEELKPRLLRLHKKRDKCRDKLLTVAPKQLQVTHAQLDRLVQGVSLALDSEPVSLSTFLLRTPLPVANWDCEHWLWHQASKEEAAALIRSLMKSTNAVQKPCDGIFLIRPSTSRPGFYALDISKNGNVHSCLIEYRDPRTAVDYCGGYGFAQTQMLFASLIDFVRHYSVVPLKEHNSVLDTPLIMPALIMRKREQRRQKNGPNNADKCQTENNPGSPMEIVQQQEKGEIEQPTTTTDAV